MARKPAFITHSREREAQVQSRILDVLTARFRRRLAAAIVAEGERIASAYRELGYVPPPSEEHQRQVREVYLALALGSAQLFGRRVVRQGKAAGHDLEHKSFADFFRSLANIWINQEAIRQRIVQVTETTRAQIVALVERGQAEGLGIDAIARDIQGRLPAIGRWRGALIARTETHGAANFAMHETAKSTGLELIKEWVAVEDMRTRRIGMGAQYDHAAMDGQQRPMDEPFDMPWVGGAGEPLKIMYPGEAGHPGGAVINCLPPWSLVRLAGLKRVMRCEYIGDLFQFSFAGPVDFTVTANHPVLTMAGWKAARHVVEGDELIYCGVGDGVPIRPNANIKHGHSRVDQLYDALKFLGGVVRASSDAVDFHGDVPNGDVDIVSAHGALRDAMVSEGHSLLGKISLADTHISKGLLLARRMVGLSYFASSDFSHGTVCSLGSGLAGLGRGHCGLPPVPFTNVRAINSQITQASVDHAARNVHGLRDAVDAVPFVKHRLNVALDAGSYNPPAISGRAFKPVKVASIKSFHYTGPVYNCETDSGLIISDGIANHNCRCAVAHTVPGLDD